MKKRGMVYDTIFLYVLSILVMLIIIVFGFQAVQAIKDRQCQENILYFAGMLQDKVSDIDNAKSSIRKETIPLGCGIEKVYFFDLREKPSSFFNGNIFMNNSLNEGSQKNIFLMRSARQSNKDKGSDIMGFSIDSLEMDFPYYACTLVEDGKIDITLESTGYSTKVWNHDYTRDCGFWEFLREIVSEVWPNEDPYKRSRHLLTIIQENQEKIDDGREITVDETFDTTEVVVTLKAKEDIETLIHLEIVSKCLAAHVDELEFDLPPTFIVNEDPLLMWQFDDVHKDDEFVIRYTVQNEIDELCKSMIKSIQETIEGDPRMVNAIVKNQEMDVEAAMADDVDKQNDRFIVELVDISHHIDDLGTAALAHSAYYKRIVWIEHKIAILEYEINTWKRSLEKFTSKQSVSQPYLIDWENKVNAKIDSLESMKERLEAKRKALLDSG